MSQVLDDLIELERAIRQLEEHHNDVLDVSEATNDNITELAEEIEQASKQLKEDILKLRAALRERIAKAKRATVIMSLLAQKEELAPIENRISKQPYEFYATSEWFKKKLSEQP